MITAASAPADRKAAIGGQARIIEAGQRAGRLVAAIAELHRIGYSHILTEGGPTLLGEIANAGLLDELCLTTSPVLAAGSASRIVNAPTSAADGTTSRCHSGTCWPTRASCFAATCGSTDT